MSIKKLNLTIVSVTLCACAQTAPATLAGEANVVPREEEVLALWFVCQSCGKFEQILLLGERKGGKCKAQLVVTR